MHSIIFIHIIFIRDVTIFYAYDVAIIFMCDVYKKYAEGVCFLFAFFALGISQVSPLIEKVLQCCESPLIQKMLQ